jgi:hypothetical protein
VKPSTIASFTSLKVLIGDSDLKFASEAPFVKDTKFEGGSVKQSCCLSLIKLLDKFDCSLSISFFLFHPIVPRAVTR